MIPLLLILALVALGAPLLAQRAGAGALRAVSVALLVPLAAALAYGAVLLLGAKPCPDGRLYGDGCGVEGEFLGGILVWLGGIGIALLAAGHLAARALLRRRAA